MGFEKRVCLFFFLITSLHSFCVLSTVAQEERLQRYERILERNPRYGPTFDMVYSGHAIAGSMDGFVARLSSPERSIENRHLLLGMVLQREGRLREAEEQYELSIAADPSQAIASYYLSKLLVQSERPEEAIVALQASNEKIEDRQLQLEIGFELAEMLHMTEKHAEASDVWDRLESRFEKDAPVRQQIATRLIELGRTNDASERLQKLLETNLGSRLQRMEWSIQIAELAHQQGETETAITQLRNLVTRVNSGSWLHDRILDLVDRIYYDLNSRDKQQAFYNDLFEKRPDDLGLVIRYGRLLETQGKRGAAADWLNDALEKAPSSEEIRLLLIDVYERSGDMRSAIEQYANLLALNDANADVVERYADALLRDESRSLEERERLASEVWKGLLNKRADDAFTVMRVAEFMKTLSNPEEARELYAKCIELQPESPEYREYFGEFLFSIGEKDEAKAQWEQIAFGPRRSRDNLIRLHDVFVRYGYLENAIECMREVCERQPTDLQILNFIELLQTDGRHGLALEQIERFRARLEASSLRERLWNSEIASLVAVDQLEAKIVSCEEASDTLDGKADSVNELFRLAFLYEANEQIDDACQAIDAALAQRNVEGTTRIDMLQVAARMNSELGDIGRALELLEQLSKLDQVQSDEYLMQISDLHLRLGDAESAKRAALNLLSATKPTQKRFEFVANLLCNLGDFERAIEVLKRNLQLHRRELKPYLMLSERQLQLGQVEKAIQNCWFAMDYANSPSERDRVVDLLLELYGRTGEIELLLRKIDGLKYEQVDRREILRVRSNLLVAEGYFVEALSLLQELNQLSPRNIGVLESLRDLAKKMGDQELAIHAQKQIQSFQPSEENRNTLSAFYREAGQFEKAAELVGTSVESTSLAVAFMKIRNALRNGQNADVEIMLEQLAADKAADSAGWELVFWQMVLATANEQRSEAIALADKLISIDAPYFDLSCFQLAESAKLSDSGSKVAVEKLVDRTEWFTRVSFNSALMSQALRSRGSVMAQVNPPLIFGDARALATTVRDFARPEKRTTMEREAIESGDIDLLWDRIVARASNGYALPQSTSSSFVFGGRQNLSGIYPPGYSAVSTNELRIYLALLNAGETAAMRQMLARLMTYNQIYMVANREKESQLPIEKEVLDQVIDWLGHAAEPEYSRDIPASILGWTINFLQSVKPELGISTLQAALENDSNSPDYLIDLARHISDQKQALLVFEKSLENCTADEFASLVESVYLHHFVSMLLGHEFHQVQSRGSRSYQRTYTLTARSSKPNSDEVKRATSLLARFFELNLLRLRALRPSQFYFQDLTSNRFNTRSGLPIESALIQAETQKHWLTPTNFANAGILRLLFVFSETHEDYRTSFFERLTSIENDAQDPKARVAALGWKAILFWNDGQKESAAKFSGKAASVQAGRQLVALLASEINEKAGNPREALNYLNQVQSRNPKTRVAVELRAIGLADELADEKRISLAVNRLLTLQGDRKQLTAAADLLSFSGRQADSRRLKSRLVGPASRNRISDEETFKSYLAAGDLSRAIPMAKAIVRKGQPNLSNIIATLRARGGNALSPQTAAAMRNFGVRTSRGTSIRGFALSTLRKQNELDEMIAKAEVDLGNNPSATRLRELLVELNWIAGKSEEARDHLVLLWEAQVSGPADGLQFAQKLFEIGMAERAAEKIFELLGKNSELAERHRIYGPVLDRAKGWGRLATVLIEDRIPIPVSLAAAVVRGLEREGKTELASKVVATCFVEDGVLALRALASREVANRFALDCDESMADMILGSILERRQELSLKVPAITEVREGKFYGELTWLSKLLARFPRQSEKLHKAAKDGVSDPRLVMVSAMVEGYEAANTKVKDQLTERVFALALGLDPRNFEDEIWELATWLLDHGYEPEQMLGLLDKIADEKLRSNWWDLSPIGLYCRCAKAAKKENVAAALIDKKLSLLQSSTSQGSKNQLAWTFEDTGIAFAELGYVERSIEAIAESHRLRQAKQDTLASPISPTRIQPVWRPKKDLSHLEKPFLNYVFTDLVNRQDVPDPLKLLYLDRKGAKDSVGCIFEEAMLMLPTPTEYSNVVDFLESHERNEALGELPIAQLTAFAILAKKSRSVVSLEIIANECLLRMNSERNQASKSIDTTMLAYFIGQTLGSFGQKSVLSNRLLKKSLLGGVALPISAAAWESELSGLVYRVTREELNSDQIRELLTGLPDVPIVRQNIAWKLGEYVLRQDPRLATECLKVAFQRGMILPNDPANFEQAISQKVTPSGTVVIQPVAPSRSRRSSKFEEYSKLVFRLKKSLDNLERVTSNDEFLVLLETIVLPPGNDAEITLGTMMPAITGFDALSNLENQPYEKVATYSVGVQYVTMAKELGQLETALRVIEERLERIEDPYKVFEGLALLAAAQSLVDQAKAKETASKIKMPPIVSDQQIAILLSCFCFDRKSDLYDYFDNAFFAGFNPSRFRETPSIHRLCVAQLRGAIEDGDLELTNLVFERLKSIYAYRKVTRQVRMKSMINAVVRTAEKVGSENIAQHYRLMMDKVSRNEVPVDTVPVVP